jgi:hypothetical protein
MEATGGARTMTGAAATVVAAGLAVVLYGIAYRDTARAMGGTCLTLTALTALALVIIRRWIVDTSDERHILQAAQREAQNERTRYIAAQAALENEQGRLTRDMAAERQRLAGRLKVERDALADEFEERRAALIAETMEATIAMIQDGKREPADPVQNKVIQLRQRPAQPERERSREHGVVGP